MATIAKRNVIIQFQADTKKARKNIKDAQRDADGLTGALRGAAASFKSLFAFAAAGAVTAGVAALGKSAAQLAINFEQTQVAFETFLGSAERANQVLGELQEFSTLTPFEPEQVIRAGQSLLAFGVEADKLTDTLRVLGDISAGTGTDFNELAELFGKARVQGRLFAEDINQLTGRGIPIIGEFAKQFGVAEAEVRDLVKEGKIGFAELEQAFVSLTSEGGKFFELTAKQSQTVGGRISTLVGNFNELLKTLGERLLPVISSAVDGLNDLVGSARAFVEVPLSEEFKAEKEELALLTLELTEANTGEDRRREIIEQLKKQYPGYLASIDTEKVTNRDLVPILNDINNALVQRIFLQEEIEKGEKATLTLAGAIKEQAFFERQLRESVQRSAEALKEQRVAFDLSGLSLKERAQLLRRLAAREEKQREFVGRTEGLTALNDVQKDLNKTIKAFEISLRNERLAGEESEEQQKRILELRGEIDEATKKLNVTTDQQTKGIKNATNATTELTKAQKDRLKLQEKLNKDLIDLENELNKDLQKEIEDSEKAFLKANEERLRNEEKQEKEFRESAAKSFAEDEDNFAEQDLKRIQEKFDAELRLAEDRRNELLSLEGITEEERNKIKSDFSTQAEDIEIRRQEAILGTLEIGSNEFLNLEQEIENRRTELALKGIQERDKIRKEQQEKELEAINQFIAANQAAANAINEIGEAVFGEQIRRLDEQIAAQEDALKDSLANIDQAGAEQVQLEENRLEELENQRARAAENLRIVTAIEVAANQAAAVAAGIAAVSKAFAEGPVQGIITSVSLAATIASSVVALRQAFGDIPAFAEGTEFFDGVGGPKSDSNLAYISRGERIVPADRNSQYFDTLNEFQNGTPMADLLHDIAQGKLPIPTVARDRQAGGDRSMLEELTAIKKHLSRLEMNVHLDKDGFSASMTKYQSNKGKFNRKLNA